MFRVGIIFDKIGQFRFCQIERRPVIEPDCGFIGADLRAGCPRVKCGEKTDRGQEADPSGNVKRANWQKLFHDPSHHAAEGHRMRRKNSPV